MGRPRIAKAPQGYLDAWEVLPHPLVRKCLAALMRSKMRGSRLVTLSRERVTQAVRVFGEDLALLATNHLTERFPDARSWRVYFSRDASVATPRVLKYQQAAALLAKGYSRAAVAAALHLSASAIQRNVAETHIAVKRRVQFPANDVADGYRLLITEGRSDLAADANVCGQVAEMRRDHGATP